MIGSTTVDWTQAPVGIVQTLLTAAESQYVVYYDANGQMTVARRRLETDDWIRQQLDNTLAIDNHNDVTCGLDRASQLPVAGNMHAAPLISYNHSRMSGA